MSCYSNAQANMVIKSQGEQALYTEFDINFKTKLVFIQTDKI